MFLFPGHQSLIAESLELQTSDKTCGQIVAPSLLPAPDLLWPPLTSSDLLRTPQDSSGLLRTPQTCFGTEPTSGCWLLLSPPVLVAVIRCGAERVGESFIIFISFCSSGDWTWDWGDRWSGQEEFQTTTTRCLGGGGMLMLLLLLLLLLLNGS